MPEATDVAYLSPSLARETKEVDNGSMSAEDWQALESAETIFGAGRNDHDNHDDQDQQSSSRRSACGDALSGRGGDDRFVVVSVFKWGYRKGWDVLLEGFWRAFLDWDEENDDGDVSSSEEVSSSSSSSFDDAAQGRGESKQRVYGGDAVLCLRSDKPRIGLTGEVFESRFRSGAGRGRAAAAAAAAAEAEAGGRVGPEIQAFARHFVTSSYQRPGAPPVAPPGAEAPPAAEARKAAAVTAAAARNAAPSSVLSEHELPAVEVFNGALSRAALRRLVGGADAFALPSRGEGWGLPIAEASECPLSTLLVVYSATICPVVLMTR